MFDQFEEFQIGSMRRDRQDEDIDYLIPLDGSDKPDRYLVPLDENEEDA